MTSALADPLLLPAAFRGTFDSTRHIVSRLQDCKGAELVGVLDELNSDLIPISLVHDEPIVAASFGVNDPPCPRVAYWLFWIAHFLSQFPSRASIWERMHQMIHPSDTSIEHRAFVLAGMEYPWFVIAALGIHTHSLAFIDFRQDDVDSFFYPLLLKMLSHVPLLVRVRKQLHSEFAGELEPLSATNPANVFSIWGLLFFLLERCFPKRADWIRTLTLVSWDTGDVSQVLHRNGIAAEVNGSLRLLWNR